MMIRARYRISVFPCDLVKVDSTLDEDAVVIRIYLFCSDDATVHRKPCVYTLRKNRDVNKQE